ncbi:MAG: divergent PAP2 family protein [Chloroflexi bacterium]|nr:divergent PAP2 family protein [Chloroflexota bacterium]
MNNPLDIFKNPVLLSALIAWGLAQGFKIPLEYLRTKRWNWALLISVGGMPSSHSALMTAVTQGIGLYVGFDTPLFALAVAISMIVIYDATGIRRQAGIHAQKINVLIGELLSGHPVSDKSLREVLGHTPLEAVGGMVLGLVVTQLLWLVWR